MYQKLKVTNSKGEQLKLYHHINLNREFLLDCRVWLNFLQTTDLRICRPFLDLTDKTGQILNFSSDASKKETLGLGAVFQNNWMAERWNPDFIKTQDPSIEVLELYALMLGLLTWSSYKELPLRNNWITIFCDNQAVVSMVNNLSTSCLQCRKFIRLIALCSISIIWKSMLDT